MNSYTKNTIIGLFLISGLGMTGNNDDNAKADFNRQLHHSFSKEGMNMNVADSLNNDLQLKSTNYLASVDIQYLDKKSNPIANTYVDYHRDGVSIGEDITDQNGNAHLDILTVGIDSHEIPEETKILLQNYPNPFRGRTTIEASINSPGILRVFDISGKTISVTKLGKAGNYKIIWSGSNIAPGIYLYNISTKNKSVTK